MDTLFKLSQSLQTEADHIINKLNLFQLWKKSCCQPFLVGALAYDLALAPDIDIEIYCDEPKIEDGFEILKACALKPGCRSVRFRNEMDGPDMGYYWQVRYQTSAGKLWKIDMWSMYADHPGPTSRDMIEPMRKALNDDTRKVIMNLKQALQKHPELKCPSIYLYQAVISENVQTLSELGKWLSGRDVTAINDWHTWLV